MGKEDHFRMRMNNRKTRARHIRSVIGAIIFSRDSELIHLARANLVLANFLEYGPRSLIQGIAVR